LAKGDKTLFAGDGTRVVGSCVALHRRVAPTRAGYCSLLRPRRPISYKRLVPGFEAPVNLAYSARQSFGRYSYPMFSTNPELKRLDFAPGSFMQSVLAFSAMVMAGIDVFRTASIRERRSTKEPHDLSPEELKDVRACRVAR